MEYTLDTIEENIQSWTERHLPGFRFRKYQFEYISKTLYSLLNGQQLNIIEAPTGAGKSILVLVMAGVLDKFYGLKSYILCSDLYLWQQYADAIDKWGLYFGKIKGTQGNYVCETSGCDYSLAPCRLSYTPYSSLFDYNWCMNNGWSCATTCEYIRERKRAVFSNVTLMTYQLYFPYMNDLQVQTATHHVFPPRDVIFCDECHNVPGLCQQYGAIPLELHKDCNRIQTFLEFCQEHNYLEPEFKIPSYMAKLEHLYQDIMECHYTQRQTLADLLSNYNVMLKKPCEINEALQNAYSAKAKKSHKKLTRKEYQALDYGKWIDKQRCSIKIYIQYSEGLVNYIVKTDNKQPDDKDPKMMVWPDNPCVCYKFAMENVWVYEFLIKHQSTGVVMLSATIGDHRTFDANIGTELTESKHSELFKIPSTFDFSKSPIYYIPGRKMSKDYLEESLKMNAALIDKILCSPKHSNEKGIIHTGSYKLAYRLIKLLSEKAKSRIHVYTDSKEKESVLEDYKRSTNGVLIGPTLLEGVDLPNDGCRFIIFLKIPYPFLGDNLVKAKSELFVNWYNSETSRNVIQGIGRGNRTPDDWSTIYILDGSFSRLYQDTHGQYPEEIRNRIHILNA